MKKLFIVVLLLSINLILNATDKIVQQSGTFNLMWEDKASIHSQSYNESDYCSNLVLGDYYDWRLPSPIELYMLVDKSKYNLAYIFPFQGQALGAYVFYSNTDRLSSSFLWTVNFTHGLFDFEWKSKISGYKCVRGAELNFSFSRDNNTSIVIENTTNLMYQDTNDTLMTNKNWDTANDYCTNLTLGSFNDWRLPSPKELRITYKMGLQFEIDNVFKNTSTSSYWSNASAVYETMNSGKPSAWAINNQEDIALAKTFEKNVRCVRGNQLSLNFNNISEKVPPVVSITNYPSSIYSSSLFSADINATDSDGNVTNYFWDFGDDTNSTSSTLSHSYSKAGAYTVKLTVTDNDGLSATSSFNVTVIEPVKKIITIAQLKTGQTTSYTQEDDGWYRAGKDRSFSRDVTSEVVTDNVTGLIWQDDTNVSTYETNQISAISYCEALFLNNKTDWRLPSRKELSTLLHFGKVKPTIDNTFKNVATGYAKSYVSSTVNAGDVISAQAIDFNGETTIGVSTSRQYGVDNVRCVRGGQLTEANLTRGTNDIVTDNVSGLMWQDNLAAKTTNVLFEVAIESCKNLELGGYKDWRLPNVNEINSIMDDTKSSPAISSIFQNSATYYWTSTSVHSNSNYAVVANFGVAQIYSPSKPYNSYDVRCVRGGEVIETNTTVSVIPKTPPVIKLLTASKTDTTVDTNIDFNATVTDSDGKITSYSWSFGDGITSSLQNPTHSFSNTGTYSVTLTAKDDDNLTATATQLITITDNVLTSIIKLSIDTSKSPIFDVNVTITSGEIIAKVDLYIDGNKTLIASRDLSFLPSSDTNLSINLSEYSKGNHSIKAYVQTLSGTTGYSPEANISIVSKLVECTEGMECYARATHSLSVKAGWSLVSLPYKTANTDMKPFKNNTSIDSIYTYTYVDRKWKLYSRSSNLSQINIIESKTGFWIKALKDTSITFNINNSIPETPQNSNKVVYRSGWNLLGTPQYSNLQSSKFDFCNGIKNIWLYRNNIWHNSKDSIFTISPIEGFWLDSSQSTTCTVY